MRRTRRVALVLSMTLVLAGAACTSEPGRDESSDRRTLLLVDTDDGSDDAMALLYLLRHPDVEVAAITVSGTGLVHCPIGVRNVAGLVHLAAPDRSIPIACGASVPTEGDRAFPDAWRTQADGRYGGILPEGPAGETLGSTDAVTLLTRTVNGSSRPVTLLTLGPLTNLALALEVEPGLADRIERVVVMGGAFAVPGNVVLDAHPTADIAEWNVYVDPTALRRVLDSGVPITFVPLDTQVPVDAYVVRAIDRTASSPPADVVARLLTSSPFFVSGQFFFWDPLAAAAVAEPSLFATRSSLVSVVTDGAGAGWTTVGGGSEAQIAAVANDADFIGAYIAAIDGRQAPIAVPRSPDAVITGGAGCSVAPPVIAAGPSVVMLASPSTAAAVGTIEPGRTDSEIEAFLATSPSGPPPWFSVSALLQTEDAPFASLVDLAPGDFTVVCLRMDAGRVIVSGRAFLSADGA